MSANRFDVRTQAPFLRLLGPFIMGIVAEKYMQFPPTAIAAVIASSIAVLAGFRFFRSFALFKVYWLTGLLINLLFFCSGAAFAYHKNICHNKNWLGNFDTAGAVFSGTIEEPLSEKANTFKTTVAITGFAKELKQKPVKGNVIVYLAKDSALKNIAYGSRISFRGDLTSLITNGMPGAFDYAAYAALQGIYHQVYLAAGTYSIQPPDNGLSFRRLMLDWKQTILSVINRYIHGPKEAGLAEALLVGYKDNLDKDLIQSYSNTGVVHVIAISGLHLGLVYVMLSLLLKPFGRKRLMRWARPLLIVSGLWIFSIIAGSSPSVLRSAVMFTFIVLGELGSRKTPILNSLSASAFLLLCFNPYWLWDAGFQLSYIAVLSLVLFMRPVYNSVYVENKLFDMGWQLSAVTIAAQILTTPLSVYLFHQFPVYFLITNLVCIPLSSIILIAELILCAISFYPAVAILVGAITAWLIRLMNGFIGYMETIPGGKWQMLQADLTQVALLYLVIIAVSVAVITKKNKYLYAALVLMIFVGTIRFLSFRSAHAQLILMVPNANGRAIDLLTGRREWLLVDKHLLKDPSLENFQLKPMRIVQRIVSTRYSGLDTCGSITLQINGKRILVVNQADIDWAGVDIFIVGRNSKLDLAVIGLPRKPVLFVFDGSVTGGKLSRWKSDCDAVGIRYWAVKEKGAFVLSLN